VRKEYRPPAAPASGPPEDLAAELGQGSLTAEELLRRYCTIVYAGTESYQETARRLQLDRRTVKRHVDPELLARLRESSAAPS